MTCVVAVATAFALVATATSVSRGHGRHKAVAAAAATGAGAPAMGVVGQAIQAASDAGVDAASTSATTAAVAAVDALDRASSASDIGSAVLDRTTGALATGASGTATFYAASVVKLFTVTDILHQAETGAVSLTSADVTMIQRALSLSDDQAMDQLWEKFGGVETVSGVIALVGLKDSSPPTDPTQWGETLLSARDVVAVYDYVLRSLSPEHRDLVMTALRNAQDTAADGFDQGFGLIAPPRPDGVAAKQGWMWIGTQFYLHSTGVLGTDDRYVVAVLTRNPASAGSATARALVNKAVTAATTPLDG